MTIPLDTNQQAALNTGATVVRDFLVLQLGSGTHAFWSGVGPHTWNSITFVGSGNLISITHDDHAAGTEANGMSLRLYANENGITPSVLQTIFSEQYRNRSVVHYQALFNPDGRTRIGNPIRRFGGYITSLEEVRSEKEFYIEGRAESRRKDFTRRGWSMANSAHHSQVSATDKFFEHSGVVGQISVYFGMSVPPAAKTNQVIQ